MAPPTKSNASIRIISPSSECPIMRTEPEMNLYQLGRRVALREKFHDWQSLHFEIVKEYGLSACHKKTVPKAIYKRLEAVSKALLKERRHEMLKRLSAEPVKTVGRPSHPTLDDKVDARALLVSGGAFEMNRRKH
jgi:hypothetical protein